MRAAMISLLDRYGLLPRALRLRVALRRIAAGADRRLRTSITRPSTRAVARRDDTMLTIARLPGGVRRAVVMRIRPPTTPAAHVIRDQHHALVTEALRIGEVPARTVTIAARTRRRIAVPAADAERALDALIANAPPTTYLFVDDPRIGPRRRLVRLHALGPITRRRALRAVHWRVFQFLGDPTARDVVGETYGCEVEFWALDADGSGLRAPRPNLDTVLLAPEEFSVPASPVRAPEGPRPVEEIDFPIDLVYTWVDGSDPAWLARRAEVLDEGARDGQMTAGARSRPNDRTERYGDATVDSRYTSYDELKYSLRSVERYADFARHIYLVTDDQRPAWLVDTHPRLTVVSHREIFDDRAHLPTFNSHAIESRLHHVPGLAEHFVYLNDDFLFGRRVGADTFFHANGLARFFPSRALVPTGPIDARTKTVDLAAINGRALLGARFGRAPTTKMRHAPYALTRGVQLELERLFPDEVARTSASRVRSATDLSMASFLGHHLGFLLGRAVPSEIRNGYVDLGRPDLDALLADLSTRRDLDTLCLNDSDNGAITPDRKREVIEAFLTGWFPEPSSFERSSVTSSS